MAEVVNAYVLTISSRFIEVFHSSVLARLLECDTDVLSLGSVGLWDPIVKHLGVL